jgi:tRNA(Ile)-lysidine synthase TilS/MesJ
MAFPRRERDLRVIRPFVYVREKSLRQFAESRDLPVIPENCPACFEAPKVSTEGYCMYGHQSNFAHMFYTSHPIGIRCSMGDIRKVY